MFKKVIVVFGGVSNENEISVITGTMAANVLKKAGVKVVPLYISQQNEYFCGDILLKTESFAQEAYKNCPRAILADGGIWLKNKKGRPKKHIDADCVLNCCHGGYGEGGGLSGICAAAGLPLVGEDIFPSAAFMDKYYTKIVLKGLGVKTVPYCYMRQNCGDVCDIPFPVIVKPATLGSSIGINAANNAEELKAALACAFVYDGAAVVEKYLSDRREINCAAAYSDGDIVVSECEEALFTGDILSFGDKYEGGGKSVCPAHIPERTAQEIKGITRYIYSSLNMRGIVRLDFVLSGGEIYVNEVNTVPGSLAYYLLAPDFGGFGEFLLGYIEGALKEQRAPRKKLLQTGILKNMPANACKSGKK